LSFTLIYEADFLECSYGYRTGRNPLQAVRELTEALHRGQFEFLVEADIKGYFEHIQHDWLLRMLALRINDGALLGLIRKWLRAGILEEDGRIEQPESGTPQGGSVSPVLANVYLHYVLDLWFERRMRKQYQGQSRLFRFADDFVCCFDYRHEAEAFERALPERRSKFGLELATDKTRRIRFGPWGGRHNGRFDFLGFEFSWGRGRRGQPTVQRRTSRKKLRGGGGSVHRMDKSRAAPLAGRVDGNAHRQVHRPLELLRHRRQLQEPEPLLLRDQPHPVQVAQSAQPTAELHVEGVQSATQALQGATATSGGSGLGDQVALPAREKHRTRQSGQPVRCRLPTGVCVSESS